MIGHILERAILHIFLDAGFFLCFFIFIDWVRRMRWMPSLKGWWAFIVPAIITLFVTYVREPFDVAGGQLTVKVVTDLISHTIGIGGWLHGSTRSSVK
jgi:hypothetical protein